MFSGGVSEKIADCGRKSEQNSFHSVPFSIGSIHTGDFGSGVEKRGVLFFFLFSSVSLYRVRVCICCCFADRRSSIRCRIHPAENDKFFFLIFLIFHLCRLGLR